MKTNILKYSLFTALLLTVFTSCVSEDDYVMPTYNNEVVITSSSPFVEDFQNATYGAGANEVPVNLAWWINTNLISESRLWHVRRIAATGNRWAEFTSFYSDPALDDEVWLITPAMSLGDASYALSFDYQIRFYNFDNLSVYISRDFDSIMAEIQEDENSNIVHSAIGTATWEPLNVGFPSAHTNDQFVPSGNISLNEFKNSSVRIAFKYEGSRQANQSTTFQLDNITIFEN